MGYIDEHKNKASLCGRCNCIKNEASNVADATAASSTLANHYHGYSDFINVERRYG